MQTNLINAAPLMMSAAAKEQGKIGQSISNSEFSRELEKVGRGMPVLGPSTGRASRADAPSAEPAGADSLARRGDSAATPATPDDPAAAGAGSSAPAASQQADQASSSLSAGTLPSDLRTKVKSLQGKMKSRLCFKDTALAEKILGQMRMPADAAKACKSTEDDHGRVSIKSLCDILDQQSGQQVQESQSRASAADVLKLIQSLQLPDGQAAAQLTAESLGMKTQGFYDSKELRTLLDQVANRISETKVSNDALLPFSHSQATTLGLVAGATDQASHDLELQDQSQRLAKSSAPSFSEDESAGAAAGMQKVNVEARQPAAQQPPASPLPENYSRVTAPEGGSVQGDGQQIAGAETGSKPAAGNAHTAQSSAQVTAGSTADKASGAHQQQSHPQRPVDQAGSSFSDNGSQGIAQGAQPGGDAQPVAASGNPTGADVANSAASLIDAAKAGASMKSAAEHNPKAGSSGTVQELGIQVDEAMKNGSQGGTGGGDSHKEGLGQEQSLFSGSGEGVMPSGGARQVDGFVNMIPGMMQTDSPVQAELGSAHGGRLSLLQPTWTQELGERLQEMTRQGKDHITLELEPQELGKLVLRIEAHQGHVSAAVSTESQHVRDLLMRNSPSLREFLQEGGMTLGSFSVDVRQEKEAREFSSRGDTSRRRGMGSSAAGSVTQSAQASIGREYSYRPAGDYTISLFA